MLDLAEAHTWSTASPIYCPQAVNTVVKAAFEMGSGWKEIKTLNSFIQ